MIIASLRRAAVVVGMYHWISCIWNRACISVCIVAWELGDFHISPSAPGSSVYGFCLCWLWNRCARLLAGADV